MGAEDCRSATISLHQFVKRVLRKEDSGNLAL